MWSYKVVHVSCFQLSIRRKADPPAQGFSTPFLGWSLILPGSTQNLRITSFQCSERVTKHFSYSLLRQESSFLLVQSLTDKYASLAE